MLCEDSRRHSRTFPRAAVKGKWWGCQLLRVKLASLTQSYELSCVNFCVKNRKSVVRVLYSNLQLVHCHWQEKSAANPKKIDSCHLSYLIFEDSQFGIASKFFFILIESMPDVVGATLFFCLDAVLLKLIFGFENENRFSFMHTFENAGGNSLPRKLG